MIIIQSCESCQRNRTSSLRISATRGPCGPLCSLRSGNPIASRQAHLDSALKPNPSSPTYFVFPYATNATKNGNNANLPPQGNPHRKLVTAAKGPPRFHVTAPQSMPRQNPSRRKPITLFTLSSLSGKYTKKKTETESCCLSFVKFSNLLPANVGWVFTEAKQGEVHERQYSITSHRRVGNGALFSYTDFVCGGCRGRVSSKNPRSVSAQIGESFVLCSSFCCTLYKEPPKSRGK